MLSRHYVTGLFLVLLCCNLCSNLSPVFVESLSHWVRPNIDEECPLSVARNQCITINEIITVSNSSPHELAHFSNLYFMPGIHTPEYTGWIMMNGKVPHTSIRNDLEIIGKTDDCHNITENCAVEIKCDSTKIGFVLKSFEKIVVKNIKVSNCGFEIHPEFGLPRQTAIMMGASAALSINDTEQITLTNVILEKSTGFGVVVVGISVKLNMLILNTTIKESNYNSSAGLQSPQSLGGNMLLSLTSKDGYSFTLALNIVNSLFSLGKGPLITFCSKFGTCISGGLTLWIGKAIIPRINIIQSSFTNNSAANVGAGIYMSKFVSTDISSSRLIIVKCKFAYNSALNGGALYLECAHNLQSERSSRDQTMITSLVIRRSNFYNNFAKINGGAIFLSSESTIPETYIFDGFKLVEPDVLDLRQSTFSSNTAGENGGGVHLAINGFIQNEYCNMKYHYKIQSSRFIYNNANSGSALSLILKTETRLRRFETRNSEFLTYITFVHTDDTEFTSNRGIGTGQSGSVYAKEYVRGTATISPSILVNLPIELKLKITRCIFSSNSAHRGAAITILISMSALSQLTFPIRDISCEETTFSGNTNPISNVSDTIGGSVIYIENLQVLSIANVNITENRCRGIHVVMSAITISGVVRIERNSMQDSHGAGIYLDFKSLSSLYPLSRIVFTMENNIIPMLYLTENKAGGYGGGIGIKSGCDKDQSVNCFYSIQKKLIAINSTYITLRNNTAAIAGDSIYGGNIEKCSLQNSRLSFWTTFDIGERDSLSAVSSPPYKVCICEPDFYYYHNCQHEYRVECFPGQIFQVPVVGVGQFNYSSPTVIHAQTTSNALNAKLDEIWTIQDVGLECKNLSFLIRFYSPKNTTVNMLLAIQNRDLEYSSRPQILTSTVYVFIKQCPHGFSLNIETGTCGCTVYLANKGLSCDIEKQVINKAPSMWIGTLSGEIAVHTSCPYGFCKSDVVQVDPYKEEEQCDFMRSGVLCGGCRFGLSLALGTSQCKKCSNNFLFLLIPFALAGVVLVILLLKCNFTVSTGTINGLIFYANIIQINRTAFFPPSLNGILTYFWSIFIAWLNLDLGIETCFSDSLNAYSRTWLQFVFPMYIWFLVILLIIVSRYSITISRLSGSNTVSVLATLFILSYTKLLRAVLDSMSSTTITDVNDNVTKRWLLDGNYQFLTWPHMILFLAALVILTIYIVPVTFLTLFAPLLQRYSHRKVFFIVRKLIPLIDSYQGPYRTKFRYWTGFLLLVRLLLMLVFASNVSGDQAMNLLAIVITMCVLLLLWVVIGGRVYRKAFPNVLEVFFQGNLLIFAASSQYLKAVDSISSGTQDILVHCMVGSAFIVVLCIVTFHSYSLLSRTRKGRAFNGRIKVFFKMFRRDQEENEDHQAVMETLPAERSIPTCTVVQLQEPLLQEDDTREDNRE